MNQVTIPAEIDALAATTVDAALAVHRAIGPGLLASAYQECLAIELSCRGLKVDRERVLPLVYRGHAVENACRLDLIVEGKLLLALKAVEAIQPIHRIQVTTYLRLLKLPLGLLINFNVPLIKDGITRVLNLDFRATTAAGAHIDQPLSPPTLASSRLRA